MIHSGTCATLVAKQCLILASYSIVSLTFMSYVAPSADLGCSRAYVSTGTGNPLAIKSLKERTSLNLVSHFFLSITIVRLIFSDPMVYLAVNLDITFGHELSWVELQGGHGRANGNNNPLRPPSSRAYPFHAPRNQEKKLRPPQQCRTSSSTSTSMVTPTGCAFAPWTTKAIVSDRTQKTVSLWHSLSASTYLATLCQALALALDPIQPNGSPTPGSLFSGSLHSAQQDWNWVQDRSRLLFSGSMTPTYVAKRHDHPRITNFWSLIHCWTGLGAGQNSIPRFWTTWTQCIIATSDRST
ncbi:MAG: hypothetical protein J3Q66DRAFT_375455 [Benniella sp.]|nr:MAG: hypothetical protein J3Q66DRAFT_375455 [Benniella sp.]